LQFFPQKISIFFNCKFFPIFGHRNPGFGTGSGSGSAIRKIFGSGSALNQNGSTTLLFRGKYHRLKHEAKYKKGHARRFVAKKLVLAHLT
jgi:hypothetical protein